MADVDRIVDKMVGQICPMTVSARKSLAGILVRYELKKGELFIREGQICKYITYVQQGMIRQFYLKSGKDLTEHFTYENGMFVCLKSFFRQIPTNLQAEALEPSVLYGLPHDALMELIDKDRQVQYFYTGILENALIISQQKADAHRFETAHERYERLKREHPDVVRRAPLSHIASYLGMTPETLSRVRAGQL